MSFSKIWMKGADMLAPFTCSHFTIDPVATRPTVFIVDDDPDVRRAIALLVRTVHLDTKAFASAQQFLNDYDSSLPGCLISDVRMPGMTGLQLLHNLNLNGISLPVIFISAHGEISTATAAMRSGAVDFIAKPFSPQLLLDRVHEAIALDEKRRSHRFRHKQVQSRIATLTHREVEIMELLAEGFSSKAIANRLGISQKTVDNHRSKVLEKMGVENSTQLARLLSTQD